MHWLPWPVWLSWLGVFSCTEKLQVWFLGREHAQVVGSIPCQGLAGGSWLIVHSHIHVSLYPSSYLNLSLQKSIKNLLKAHCLKPITLFLFSNTSLIPKKKLMYFSKLHQLVYIWCLLASFNLEIAWWPNKEGFVKEGNYLGYLASPKLLP